jgi:transposase
MFVPLSHRPGHAQADFGEADGCIGGKKVRFHYFCMDLPHSDGCFVKAYPAETAEAFCDGHVAAFDFFGAARKSDAPCAAASCEPGCRLQGWRRSTPDKARASWMPAVHADGIRAELKNSASS